MRTHANKTQETKSQSVSSNKLQTQVSDESTFQFVDKRPEAIAQRKLQEMANNSPQSKQAVQLQTMVDNNPAGKQQTIHKKETSRGLPDSLITGMKHLSGISLDDVKVYRNSNKPAQLQAHAYAQGTDIHLGPGQEKHLPHEAWHVVQQKQGRVKPTIQLKDKVNVNDDAGLEKEADVMGKKAKAFGESSGSFVKKFTTAPFQLQKVIQLHDPHNNARLAAARTASSDFVDQEIAGELAGKTDEEVETHTTEAHEMQMDHGTSQNNLNNLSEGLELIRLMTLNGRTKYTLLRTAYNALFAQLAGDTEDFGTENIRNTLLNIPANLTPGFANTIGNPGNTFDPEVEEGDNGKVDQTASVAHLMTIESNQRKIDKLSNKMPNAEQATHLRYHNPKLENLLVAALNAIRASLQALNNVQSNFDEDIWDRHNGKWVKKVAAQYVDDLPNASKEAWAIPDESEFNWNFLKTEVDIERDERTAEDSDAEVTYVDDTQVDVKVTIPSTAWEHIYERHTYGQFIGDVQAVNTFWKTNPSTTITRDLLKPELNLMIDRYLSASNIEDGASYAMNGVANDLFFQGDIDYSLEGEDDDVPTYSISIKSIAPQKSSLAYAILPATLKAIFPVQHQSLEQRRRADAATAAAAAEGGEEAKPKPRRKVRMSKAARKKLKKQQKKK